MPQINSIKKRSNVRRDITEVVVPDDVGSILLDFRPPETYGGPTNITQFVDKYLLAELNGIAYGRLERTNVKRGGRAIHVVLLSSTLYSSAPVPAQALAAGLSSRDDAFALYAVPNGDVWLIAGRVEGLRHACFDYLTRLGFRFVAAHPAWTTRPTGLAEINASDLMRPAVGGTAWAGNGGLNTHGITFAGPLRDAQQAAAILWYDWYAREMQPRNTINSIGGDGGLGFTYFKQNALAADHTMLAWNIAAGKRGLSNVSGTIGFPTACFASTLGVVSKLCVNHHGTVGAGPSYPAAPGGATPWAGVVVTGPFCTVGTSPRSPGTNDPGPDSATPPALSDYTSFDGLVKLYCNAAWEQAAYLVDSGIDEFDPHNAYVSVSPNDGAFTCECVKCRDMVRLKYGGTADSNPSDLNFDLANAAAKFLTWQFASSTFKPKVSISAYADHSMTPYFGLEKNICVTLLPQTAGGSNITVDETLRAWSNKRSSNPAGPFELGIQATWLIATNRDVPRMSPRDGITEFLRFISLGYTTAITTQTSFSNIACGAMYHAINRLAWRPGLDPETLLSEFFVPLGAAGPACRVMLERCWKWFELNQHEIGACYVDMQTAQAALVADPKATANQQTCLNHVRSWVHWLRVYFEFTVAQKAWLAGGSPTTGTLLSDLLSAIDVASLHGWNMSLTQNAIEADLHVGQHLYAAIPATGTGTTAMLAKWDRTNAAATGFASVADPTTAGLTSIINAGVASYTLISGVTRKTYQGVMASPETATRAIFTGALTPLGTSTDPTLINTGRLCVSYQTYRFRKPAGDVVFHLQQAQLGAGLPTPPTRIRVLDASGAALTALIAPADGFPTPVEAVGIVATNPTGFIDHTITVTNIPAGDYTLEFNDVGIVNGNQYLQWPRSVPLVWLNPQMIREFQQAVKLYFYVPLGETKVALSFDSKDPIQFYKPNGSGGFVAQTTALHGAANMWVCDVPAGLDGQIWAFDHMRTNSPNRFPQFENCPSLFAFDPKHVMVPVGLDGHF